MSGKKRKLESVKRNILDLGIQIGKKHTVDKRVQDRHGTVRDTGIRVNLLQNCKEKDALDDSNG